jgi:methyl-accepting chemotaxis protein
MRRIIILLLSFIPLLPSSGQAPVTDVAHTTATTLGHFKSFEEAVRSGVQLLNQLTVLKQTYEGIKMVKETFDKINQYIYNIQAITDAMQNLIDITQRSSELYRQVARSNTFKLDELTYLMDYLTSAIQQGTRNVGEITDYVSSNKWRFTDKERKDGIEDSAERAKKIKEELDAVADGMESIIETRKDIAYMNENGLFTPMEAYVANVS